MSRLTQLFDFLKSQPDEPFLLYAIAKEYEGLGQTDEALDYYLKLTTTAPQYVGTYYHLGKLYERLDAPDKALATYATGIEVARAAKDQHALSELMGAKMNLNPDDDDDDDY